MSIAGATAKMLADESNIDTMSTPIAFVRESLIATRELIEDPGIRGTRSRSKERVTRGLIRVGGQTVHQPSPAELDAMLPWLLGADESTDTFALAETLQEVNIAILRGSALASAGMFTYGACKCGRWEFSGSEGSAIQLSCDWVGKTVTTAAGASFPSVALDEDGVYIFQGGVLTLEGNTVQFSEFSLSCDNFAEAEFNNSQTATAIDALDRDITLNCNIPWDATEEANQWNVAEGDTLAEGAAGSLVFSSNRSGQLLTFTFGNVKPAPLVDPQVGGKQKIRWPSTWKILKSSTTNELVVTHDSTAS